ncbi:MAG: hypothetical protein MJ105_03555 [Lachnospiraceae bacterium]|nr:hypothetical protein [Lachnospiraceae bacterium]
MKKRWIGMMGILAVTLTGCSLPFGQKNNVTEETESPNVREVVEDEEENVEETVPTEEENQSKPEEVAPDEKQPEEGQPDRETEEVDDTLDVEMQEDPDPSDGTEEGSDGAAVLPDLSYEDLVGVFMMVTAEVDDGFVTTSYRSEDGILSNIIFYEDGTADYTYLSYDEEFSEFGLSVVVKEGAAGLEGTLKEDIAAETWTFTYDGETLTFLKETKVNASNTTKNIMVFEKTDLGTL